MHTYLSIAAIGVASFGLGYMIRAIHDGQLTNRRLITASVLLVVAFAFLVTANLIPL